VFTNNRPLATLLLTCAAAGALAPEALAATAKPASAAVILADCVKDSQISHRYRLADLKKAKTTFTSSKANRKKYANCEDGLYSAIAALSGKAGKNSADAIVLECTKSDRLTHRYKLATLKKASKSLPADVKNYGNCGDAIASQIHTLS
jgi:phage I-like protein